jgi:hypothetical protein
MHATVSIPIINRRWYAKALLPICDTGFEAATKRMCHYVHSTLANWSFSSIEDEGAVHRRLAQCIAQTVPADEIRELLEVGTADAIDSRQERIAAWICSNELLRWVLCNVLRQVEMTDLSIQNIRVVVGPPEGVAQPVRLGPDLAMVQGQWINCWICDRTVTLNGINLGMLRSQDRVEASNGMLLLNDTRIWPSDSP